MDEGRELGACGKMIMWKMLSWNMTMIAVIQYDSEEDEMEIDEI